MNNRPDPASTPAGGGVSVRILGIIARSSWLALGEGATRLANFLIAVVVANIQGAEGLGTFALGQIIGTYLTLGTDFGYKTTGARAVSLHRSWTGSWVSAIQRRRAMLGAAVFPAGIVYAAVGPVPEEARWFVAGFALSVLPLAFTLDWALLGLEQFARLGLLRTGVAVVFAAASVAWLLMGGGLVGVAVANGTAAFAGALAVWWLWFRGRSDAAHEGLVPEAEATIARDTSLRSVAWLGLATIGVQMFQSIDTLLLGGLVPVEDVGRYNAAHKLVVLIFGVYYLFTQSLLPTLARWGDGADVVRRVRRWTIASFLTGGVVGAALAVLAGPIIVLVYGERLAGASDLLERLSMTIPLEFSLALLGTALVAWNRERLVLVLAVAGLALNVALNAVVIPAAGALGAAHVKIVSYVAVVGLLWASIDGTGPLRRLSDALDRVGRP